MNARTLEVGYSEQQRDVYNRPVTHVINFV